MLLAAEDGEAGYELFHKFCTTESKILKEYDFISSQFVTEHSILRNKFMKEGYCVRCRYLM